MGTHSKSDKARRKLKYEQQKPRTEANRKRKLEKHIIKHPNDGVAKSAQ